MNNNSASLNTRSRSVLILLPCIFFFSGAGSLVYQVVWQRMLTLYYGVGSVSTTIIVSVYMLGLGIGAYAGGLLAERVKNRIALYCAIELLLGFFGFISPHFLNLLGNHTSGSSHIVALCWIFVFLCFPTTLMGMTLPLIIKIFNAMIDNFLRSVSLLYFINTLGAAAGSLITSYIIISFFGLDTAIMCAVAINISLALVIFLIRTRTECEITVNAHRADRKDAATPFGRSLYAFVLITGFLAIGYEIIWFRVIGVLAKASPYAFSSILAVYLLGIALGSYGMDRLIHSKPDADKKNLFFLLQAAIGLYVLALFLGYYYLTAKTSLGFLTRISFYTELHPSFVISFASPKAFFIRLFAMFDVFIWSSLFVLPPTILMGASFPLTASLALTRLNKEAQTVGTVYFFTIAGNVLGGIGTGFVLLPMIGTELTLLAFAILGLFFFLLSTGIFNRPIPLPYRIGIVIGTSCAVVALFPKQGDLYRIMHSTWYSFSNIFIEEGVDGIVLTYQEDERMENYINGLGHGYRPGYGYFVTANETVRYTPNPENVLIIGYGIGSTAEAILKIDTLKKLTIVELSQTLMTNLQKISVFQKMLSDPRVNLVIDDGRRYLMRSGEQFDLILIDPLRTTTAYSNNIYSREFFQIIGHHLTDNGVFMLFLQDEYKVLPKTLALVFPHIRLYTSYCLASKSPLQPYDDQHTRLLATYSPLERERMAEPMFAKFERYIGNETNIREMTRGYPVNSDLKPVCEYYIGLKFKNFVNRIRRTLR